LIISVSICYGSDDTANIADADTEDTKKTTDSDTDFNNGNDVLGGIGSLNLQLVTDKEINTKYT